MAGGVFGLLGDTLLVCVCVCFVGCVCSGPQRMVTMLTLTSSLASISESGNGALGVINFGD